MKIIRFAILCLALLPGFVRYAVADTTISGTVTVTDPATYFGGAGTITFPSGTTPISPPSGPLQWLFQGPPAQSKFLAAQPPFPRPPGRRIGFFRALPHKANY